MTKHVVVGATVEAYEVTDSNIDRLADKHGGTVHTSVREQGKRFATFESEDGTLRVDVGGYVVLDRDETKVIDGFSDPDEFRKSYERP